MWQQGSHAWEWIQGPCYMLHTLHNSMVNCAFNLDQPHIPNKTSHTCKVRLTQ